MTVTETPPAWLGESAALMVLSFDVDAESAVLSNGSQYRHSLMLMSHQSYGPDVGVGHILGMLADFGLRATFFVTGQAADAYPGPLQRILEAGHEVGAHSYSHRPPTTMTPDDERRDFERSLEALERLGATVLGHRAPLSSASMLTPVLVAEHGLVYQSTLMDDDRPYRLRTDGGEIIELPPHWALDDWLQYVHLPLPGYDFRMKPPDEVLQAWTGELAAARRYGCLLMLTMHPDCTGRPSRLAALRRLIESALTSGDVEILTAIEAATRAQADPDLACRNLADLDPHPDPAVYPVE